MEDSTGETVREAEYEDTHDLPLCRPRGERECIISGSQVSKGETVLKTEALRRFGRDRFCDIGLKTTVSTSTHAKSG